MPNGSPRGSKKNRDRSSRRVLQRVSRVSEASAERMTRGRTPMMSSVGGYSRLRFSLYQFHWQGYRVCSFSKPLYTNIQPPLPLFPFSFLFSSLPFHSLLRASFLFLPPPRGPSTLYIVRGRGERYNVPRTCSILPSCQSTLPVYTGYADGAWSGPPRQTLRHKISSLILLLLLLLLLLLFFSLLLLLLLLLYHHRRHHHYRHRFHHRRVHPRCRPVLLFLVPSCSFPFFPPFFSPCLPFTCKPPLS